MKNKILFLGITSTILTIAGILIAILLKGDFFIIFGAIIASLSAIIALAMFLYLFFKKGTSSNKIDYMPNIPNFENILAKAAVELLLNKTKDYSKEERENNKINGGFVLNFIQDAEKILSVFSLGTVKKTYYFQYKNGQLELLSKKALKRFAKDYPELLETNPEFVSKHTKKLSIEEILEIFDGEITNIKELSKNTNIEEIQQKYPFLPKDYLKFVQKYNMVDFGDERICIRGIINQPHNLPADELEFKKEFLSNYKEKFNVEDFFFIGDDENACYFAFSTKLNDTNLYMFDDEMDYLVTKFKSFTDFLNKKLNK